MDPSVLRPNNRRTRNERSDGIKIITCLLNLVSSCLCDYYLPYTVPGISLHQLLALALCNAFTGKGHAMTTPPRCRRAALGGCPRRPFSTEPWWEMVPVPDLHGSLGEATKDKLDYGGRRWQLVETSTHAQE